MKISEVEKIIQKEISGYHLSRLVEMFEETECRIIDIDVAAVRGAIMNELEKRDAERYEKWILALENSPRAFYL